METVEKKVKPRIEMPGQARATVNWPTMTQDVRIELKHLYPAILE
jgi:hypothetical protein